MLIIKIFRRRVYRNQVPGLPIGLLRSHSDCTDHCWKPLHFPKIKDLCSKAVPGPCYNGVPTVTKAGLSFMGYTSIWRYVGAGRRGEGCTGPVRAMQKPGNRYVRLGRLWEGRLREHAERLRARRKVGMITDSII